MVRTKHKIAAGRRRVPAGTTGGLFEKTAFRVGAIDALEARAARRQSRRSGVAVERILERHLGADLSRKIRAVVKRASQTCARCGAARGALGCSSREFTCRCPQGGARPVGPRRRRSRLAGWR